MGWLANKFCTKNADKKHLKGHSNVKKFLLILTLFFTLVLSFNDHLETHIEAHIEYMNKF